MYEKDKMYLPQSCEHLFDTFHRLREGDNNNPNVPSKVVVLQKSKGSSHEEVQKEETLTQAHQAFSKRPSPDESDSSRRDRILRDPSRTMTAHIKETQSAFAYKAAEVENSESLLRAKEHLDLVLTKKNKKAEELSAANRSVKEAKNTMKELRALRGAAKNEVDEIKSKV
ncbi:hypothetical protein RND71_019139 [Anisodus tanguticus]|uniref:Uncharacterized protein n=1 Tax=Anisodus tanguticus TaxID=243964 RepID=A0AAE1V960_9SOLA|nr:hypothetical protein RND71_019139 [Anisodus tanguticus]